MAADDDPLGRMLDRRRQVFLAELREEDRLFAEASVVHLPDMAEWQAAVYLLTGCEPVWQALGDEIVSERSPVAALLEVEHPRRAWSEGEREAMRWALHFWDQARHPAEFPAVFDRHLFARWIVAAHLRQGLVPVFGPPT
jgi:hypothetical protein